MPMKSRMRFVLATGVLASILSLALVAFAGESYQSKDGLTCHNKWSGDNGSTKCKGTNTVKWRLRVRCKWQSDYTGPWNHGPGSDAFKCNHGAQSAGVQWG